MPLLLIGILVAGGVVLAAAGSRRATGRRVTLVTGKAVGGDTVAPGVDGWRVARIVDSSYKRIIFGFCVKDYKDRARQAWGGNGADVIFAIMGAIGEFFLNLIESWLGLEMSGPCYTLSYPGHRIEFTIGGGEPIVLYAPQMPTGGPAGDVRGWDPARPLKRGGGFPVQESQVQGLAGGEFYVREVGDIWDLKKKTGCEVPVYQIVAKHKGKWRSYPAMPYNSWRWVMSIGGLDGPGKAWPPDRFLIPWREKKATDKVRRHLKIKKADAREKFGSPPAKDCAGKEWTIIEDTAGEYLDEQEIELDQDAGGTPE